MTELRIEPYLIPAPSAPKKKMKPPKETGPVKK